MVRLNGLTFASLLAFVYITTAEDCDQCQFDGNDAADCKDYGKLSDNDNDKVLIGWSLGSQDCLDSFNIKIETGDPAQTCASAISFVNALRFGELKNSQAKLGLGVAVMTGGFFEQKNTAIVLKSKITVDKVNYIECEKEGDCYNAMKPYFDKEGSDEMKQVCETLFNKVRLGKQQEQSVLRIRLCTEQKEAGEISESCNPLNEQIKEQITGNPDRVCSSYGFGAGTTVIPGCGQSSNTTNTFSPTTSPTNSAMKVFQFDCVLLITFFVGLMF